MDKSGGISREEFFKAITENTEVMACMEAMKLEDEVKELQFDTFCSVFLPG